MEQAGVDRTAVLDQCIETVRRGGTLSISGVYGGTANPINMLQLFDKQIQVRMGQANVKVWVDEIMSLLTDADDPPGVEDFATHELPLDDAPHAFELESLLRLAGRTVVGGAARRFHLLYLSVAPGTVISLPPMGEQERAGQASGVRPAFDRCVQHALGLLVEIVEGVSIQPRDAGSGMEADLEQDLVGIDVADPGEDLLVHQRRFDLTPPPFEPLSEGGEIQIQGVKTQLSTNWTAR